MPPMLILPGCESIFYLLGCSRGILKLLEGRRPTVTETNGSGINLGWDKLDAAVAVSCGQGAGKQWTFRCAGEESLIYMRANQFPHQKGHFFLRALPASVMSSTQRSSLGCLQVISDPLDEQHWSAFHYLDVRNFL